jgi:hypothetical protein
VVGWFCVDLPEIYGGIDFNSCKPVAVILKPGKTPGATEVREHADVRRATGP